MKKLLFIVLLIVAGGFWSSAGASGRQYDQPGLYGCVREIAAAFRARVYKSL
jgi:hypothetical protein